jgi:hypothetical protein
VVLIGDVLLASHLFATGLSHHGVFNEFWNGPCRRRENGPSQSNYTVTGFGVTAARNYGDLEAKRSIQADSLADALPREAMLSMDGNAASRTTVTLSMRLPEAL